MNKCIFIGNAVREPEFMTTNNGISNCKFTIAVNRKYKNNEGETETDFINVVTWRGLADNCIKYLRKGNKCCVVGSLQTRTYDAQDGTKRYVTEIIADEVEFLSPKSENDNKPKTENQEKQEIMQNFEPIDDSMLPF